MKSSLLALALLCLAPQAWADDDKIKAAVGGGIGGAVGAVVGDELGDRKGAIVGSAIGAAIGTAMATAEDKPRVDAVNEGNAVVVVEVEVQPNAHPKGRHCPPGQAKKGRC